LLLPELDALDSGKVLPPDKTGVPPRLWSFKTDAMDELIKELGAEREKLAADQKSAVMLQSQAVAERAELEKKRAEIQAMKDEIELRVVEIQEHEVRNLKTLAQTYSAMPPPAAVAIFRELDENTAVKILATMKVDRVGPILGEMAKTADRVGEETMARRAARITDKLRLLKPAKKENP
jgi:flagellar motility protein MotE (MotC chaperone)